MNRPISTFNRGWRHYQVKNRQDNLDYLKKYAPLLIETKQSSPVRSRFVTQTK